jgi:HSP20 family protein
MQEGVEVQQVPVKVCRTAERLTVAAPMPGLQPEDITVEVTADGYLVLNGPLRSALKGEKSCSRTSGRWARIAAPWPCRFRWTGPARR